jgi:hypothetical protein
MGERDYAQRSLLDKLGVKPGMTACVFGMRDEWFLHDLRSRAAAVSVGRRRSRADLVFFGAREPDDLATLASLRPVIHPDGAIWVVYPKGRKEVRELDVIAGGLAAGLVDNKVVRFSDTHTALRFVIRRSERDTLRGT